MCLPHERVLADSLGVSRGTLRASAARLKIHGMLASRPGNGVFITTRLRSSINYPWSQLVNGYPDLL